MPPNATSEYASSTNSRFPPGATYDPLLNFSYYPSNTNFSGDFGAALGGTSAPPSNSFAGIGGLAADSNPYPTNTGNNYNGNASSAFDYASSTRPASTSWLHGDDYLNFSAGNKSGANLSGSNYFTATEPSYLPNLSSVNLDQIKIGDQTMENVLKAFDSDHKSEYPDINRALNGLNLDSSFTTKKYTNYDLDKKYGTSTFADIETGPSAYKPRYSSFDAHDRPVNRSSIIKSHQNQSERKTSSVSFQPHAQFFSPDNSMLNMTLPNVDASVLLSDDFSASRREEAKFDKFSGFKGNKTTSSSSSNERDQFLAFAAQQYRILASMNPEMMQAPSSIEDLADRETFKYWARLLIEERERQARIVLNLQKALTEALSSAAANGPHTMTHLGAASGDAELEDIGRFADLCRKRSQVIADYMNNKRRSSRFY